MLLDCLNHKTPWILSAYPELCQTVSNKDYPSELWNEFLGLIAESVSTKHGTSSLQVSWIWAQIHIPDITWVSKRLFSCQFSHDYPGVDGMGLPPHLDQQMKVWGESWGLKALSQATKLPSKQKAFQTDVKEVIFARHSRNSGWKWKQDQKQSGKFLQIIKLSARHSCHEREKNFSLEMPQKRSCFKNFIFCSYLPF